MREEPPEFLRPREYVREGGLVGVWRFARRHRHLTVPLLAPWLLFAAGWLLAWQRYSPVTEGAVALSACVVMWSVAPRKWDAKPRHPRRRPAGKRWRWTSEVAYARATVIAASGWLLLAARHGPHTPALEWSLAALGASWGFLYWRHKRPHDKRARRRHAAGVARWDAWWQSHAPAWGLAVRHVAVNGDGTVPLTHASGSYVADFTEHAGMVSLLIQLWKGRQTVADIKRVLPLAESALGGYVAHGMTRAEVNKADPSQVWLHLKRENPLREVIPFSEDMLPADITRPAPLGVRETGAWLKAVLRKSLFAIGATRTGKSNELSVIFSAITHCRNARLWLIDMKGGRSMRPWLRAVDWPAVTMAETQLMLACGVAETKARATYATSGEEQLEPTDGVPTIFTAIDETYEVTSEAAGQPGGVCARDLARLSSQGAGVEMYAIVATQYGSLPDSVQTEQTRMNLRRRMCFQVEHPDHGTFALGEDSRNGSADPTKLEEPGTFYYREDSKTVLEQVRGPEIPHRRAREIAARNAELTGVHRRPLLLYCGNQPCPLMPGKTWQQVYDERWSRLPAAFHADAPQAVTVSPSPAQRDAEPTKINSGEPADDIAAQVAGMNAEIDELPVTVADIARARAQRAARGAPDFDLRADDDQCRRRFAALLDSAPPGGIAPRVLAQGSGFSREWVRRLLNALVEGNAVERIGTGRYRPLMAAWEALEILREASGKLGAEAREMAGV